MSRWLKSSRQSHSSIVDCTHLQLEESLSRHTLKYVDDFSGRGVDVLCRESSTGYEPGLSRFHLQTLVPLDPPRRTKIHFDASTCHSCRQRLNVNNPTWWRGAARRSAAVFSRPPVAGLDGSHQSTGRWNCPPHFQSHRACTSDSYLEATHGLR